MSFFSICLLNPAATQRCYVLHRFTYHKELQPFSLLVKIPPKPVRKPKSFSLAVVTDGPAAAEFTF